MGSSNVQLKVAFTGEEAAGVQALRLLAQRGHEVCAVFTGARSGGSSASVASTAASLGVPVRGAAEVREPALAEWLRDQQIDVLLSVHSRHLVDAEVLGAPRLGAFNLHPGPLPEYAGLNVVSWALHEGEDRHGVTLHHMTPVYDAGPVVFVDRFELQSIDTALSVLVQCVRRGMTLLGDLLDLLERDEAVPAHPQDLSGRRWFGARPPKDGLVDWAGSARSVANLSRACDYGPFPSPWGVPRCVLDGLDVGILQVTVAQKHDGADPGTVARADDDAVLIAAADAWVRVEQVVCDGGRQRAAEVLRDGSRLTVCDGDSCVPVAS